MAVFRSLLNLLVIGVLLLVGNLPEKLIFGLALAMLLVCAANVLIIQASHAVRDRDMPTKAEGMKLIVPREPDDSNGTPDQPASGELDERRKLPAVELSSRCFLRSTSDQPSP